MSKIEVSEIIKVPIDKVFEYSVNYPKRMEWDTFSKKMEFLDGANEVKVGGRTKTYTHYGLTMETEYVSRNDPQAYAVKMIEGPAFIKSFAGTWRYKALDADTTEVSFIYNIITWLFVQPIFDVIYKRDMKKRIRALKQFMEKNG